VRVRILWATTFSADLWAVSGKLLIESYVKTRTPHHLVAFTEGMDLPPTPRAIGKRLDDDPFLKTFLAAHRDVIPVALGGALTSPECRCAGGPYDLHY